MVTTLRVKTAPAVAEEFLTQWDQEYQHTNDQPDYEKLAREFAHTTGQVSMGFADKVGTALHKGCIARGWDGGDKSNGWTVEGVVMMLWLGELRGKRREQYPDNDDL